ncbi:hypothetical protein Rhe02_46740 [Rhizocola hellebori]|uniref:Uncharacterized protein n=1 Tax=Rhizocola hellebori TaxID=1392758 RepID=A0A8J3QBA9_9ACTN|nr:hypothetical protein [Rhizocola hellebori]GIH06607.1 hypothetical protein Rhe02_46740 [Rhizocola hellebori]
MPQRFRPLVPLPGRLILLRIFALVMGLFGIVTALIGTRSSSSLESVFFFAICLMMFRLSLCGLASNAEAVSIVKGWTSKVVRYDTIESFEWLHNLESFGAPGKRLWIVLDDGQRCPVPVVVGHSPMFKLLSSDIWLTPDQAAAVVADLQTRRRAARVTAE